MIVGRVEELLAAGMSPERRAQLQELVGFLDRGELDAFVAAFEAACDAETEAAGMLELLAGSLAMNVKLRRAALDCVQSNAGRDWEPAAQRSVSLRVVPPSTN